MDVSTWIALGALVVSAANPAVSSALRNSKHEGKVDEILDQLTRITTDHEGRLRKGRL